MEQKTKWYNSSRRTLLQGAGQVLGEEHAKRASRARVFRGEYSLEESSVLISADEPSLPQVSSSSLRPVGAETADEVRIEYDPSHYGITRVETMEEREDRFRAELDDLNSQLVSAKVEIETAREQGHETGFQEGIAQGKQAAMAELQVEVDAKLKQLETLLDTIVAATRDYFNLAEQKLVKFALMIAGKIVGDAANAHEGIATSLAKEALKQANERTTVSILCHLDDEAELQAAGIELKTVSEGIREIEVRSSPRVSRGGIILETLGGSVDATIETILEELHIALLEDEPPTNKAAE
jgi:flagellar biosynthesis/type III secretory pathway protein FliH